MRILGQPCILYLCDRVRLGGRALNSRRAGARGRSYIARRMGGDMNFEPPPIPDVGGGGVAIAAVLEVGEAAVALVEALDGPVPGVDDLQPRVGQRPVPAVVAPGVSDVWQPRYCSNRTKHSSAPPFARGRWRGSSAPVALELGHQVRVLRRRGLRAVAVHPGHHADALVRGGRRAGVIRTYSAPHKSHACRTV